jgi:hypothetical protein
MTENYIHPCEQVQQYTRRLHAICKQIKRNRAQIPSREYKIFKRLLPTVNHLAGTYKPDIDDIAVDYILDVELSQVIEITGELCQCISKPVSPELHVLYEEITREREYLTAALTLLLENDEDT